MKLGRTIVFILLFAAATGTYVYQAHLTQQALTNIPDEVNRNVTITPDDAVDLITLVDHVQKTRIELQKKNDLPVKQDETRPSSQSGAWALAVPVRYPAESRIVEGLVAAARMASRQPRLRAEKEWTEYGLTHPELEITFNLPDKKPVTLLIGEQVPVGKAIFARWSDERGYFLLPPEMKSVFRQSVYGLREKRVFRAPAETFQKISIEMGKRSFQWKKDGKEWYWFEPVSKFGQKVSAEQMNSVLSVLQSLHVKEFQDNNKKSKAELGFFMIHDRIRVESENGKVEAFYFGNEVPERNAYYGIREGEDTVFFVDRGNVIQLFDVMQKIQPEDGEPKAGPEKSMPPSGILHPTS